VKYEHLECEHLNRQETAKHWCLFASIINLAIVKIGRKSIGQGKSIAKIGKANQSQRLAHVS
jgi:hypothetical protein